MSDNVQSTQQQGATSPPETSTTTQVFEESSGAEAPEQTATSAVEKPAVTPPVTLTKEQLQEIVSTSVRAARPEDKPEAPRMTQEELNRMLNVFQVSPDHATKLGLSAESAPVLNELLQAAVKQAVTMAAYQMEAIRRQQEQKFDTRLTPLQQYMQQRQEAQYREQFYKDYPEFKGFEPLVESTYKSMLTEGVRFDTPEEALKAIAERTRKVKTSLPGFSEAEQQQKKAAATPKQKMSTLSGAGQLGGEESGASSHKNTAKWLFGPQK
jgi:hypothetical protein